MVHRPWKANSRSISEAEKTLLNKPMRKNLFPLLYKELYRDFYHESHDALYMKKYNLLGKVSFVWFIRVNPKHNILLVFYNRCEIDGISENIFFLFTVLRISSLMFTLMLLNGSRNQEKLWMWGTRNGIKYTINEGRKKVMQKLPQRQTNYGTGNSRYPMLTGSETRIGYSMAALLDSRFSQQ
jgi:hypothetical protein